MSVSDQYADDIDFAVRSFWDVRANQVAAQKIKDAGNRGAVTAAQHLNGMLLLLSKIAQDVGILEQYIHIKGNQNQLPGYFRATKAWDFIITSPKGHLLTCIELKSQVGSVGNNSNNRMEEALGCATDFWAAYKEVLPEQQRPWLGYIFLTEETDANTKKRLEFKEPYFPIAQDFKNTSYVDRYELFCRKLIQERHYDGAALLLTKRDNDITYRTPSSTASFHQFLEAYRGYLVGKSAEFK